MWSDMCILGYTGTGTHFAFCPPDANYGTIDSYPWACPQLPDGGYRESAPYFSNPSVNYQGIATGDAEHNNAGYMIEERFAFRDAGSNCLDGNPDEKWMTKLANGEWDPEGTIGNNCPNGEESFEPPLSLSEGNICIA